MGTKPVFGLAALCLAGATLVGCTNTPKNNWPPRGQQMSQPPANKPAGGPAAGWNNPTPGSGAGTVGGGAGTGNVGRGPGMGPSTGTPGDLTSRNSSLAIPGGTPVGGTPDPLAPRTPTQPAGGDGIHTASPATSNFGSVPGLGSPSGMQQVGHSSLDDVASPARQPVLGQPTGMGAVRTPAAPAQDPLLTEVPTSVPTTQSRSGRTVTTDITPPPPPVPPPGGMTTPGSMVPTMPVQPLPGE
jgi:hypothetical protein